MTDPSSIGQPVRPPPCGATDADRGQELAAGPVGPRFGRVLFLQIKLQIGGAELSDTLLCRALPRYGLDASVATFYPSGPVPPRFGFEGLLVAKGLAADRLDPRGLVRLVALLRRERIDLLHVGLSPVTQIWGHLARRLAGVPAMCAAIHVGDFADEPARRGVLRRLMLPRLDGVVALTEGHRRKLVQDFRLDPRRVHAVPSGALPWDGTSLPGGRRALGIAPDGPLIGIVAVLKPYKAVDHFVRAAARVREVHPDAQFVVLGDGPERPALEQLAGQLGLEAAVTFLGHRDDADRILPLLDLQVLSSVHTEAFPRAIVEGMAVGLPVVATRVGFLDELVADRRTGRLVSPGDPGALAEAMLWVLADPDRARELGDAGRRHFEAELTADRMAERYAEMARGLIARTGRRG